MKKYITKNCQYCDKEFQSWKCNNRKFCSERCSAKYQNLSPKTEKQIEQFKKIRQGFFGHHTEETKKKISEVLKMKGIKPPINKGDKLTDEHKKNLSVAHLGAKSGKVWKGGLSFEPYSVDWTRTLKKSIRERDHYTCQICGQEPATHCHHIDYDKQNCNPDNLITLCSHCHPKTNNDREEWIKYFKESI